MFNDRFRCKFTFVTESEPNAKSPFSVESDYDNFQSLISTKIFNSGLTKLFQSVIWVFRNVKVDPMGVILIV